LMPRKVLRIVARELLRLMAWGNRVEGHAKKGWIVVPIRLREKLEIHSGAAVAFLEAEGRLILQPITKKYVAKLREALQGEPAALQTLLRERKRGSERGKCLRATRADC
jgi:bifunctional DNA-binding transcriptional regulator/antitoxin component of YhaV-PrlF toxin-antitoxin module